MKNIIFSLIGILFIASQTMAQYGSAVLISSKPSGASVLINNEEVGKTPYEAVLKPGLYSIVVRKYKDANSYYFQSAMCELENLEIEHIDLQLKVLYTDKYKQALINPQMVEVKGGTFDMGNTGGTDDERPVHKVKLPSFEIGKYEITVAQYRAYVTETEQEMPEAPPWGWLDDHPIINVTYSDAVGYCEWLSGNSGETYRLPTEAEWEFAARGGRKSKNYEFSGSNTLDEVAWYVANSTSKTQAVGQKTANEIGIYDMSGNAMEWCSDWFDPNYYSISPESNPQGAEEGALKVVRGGAWTLDESRQKVYRRNIMNPESTTFSYGFRLVKDKE